MQAGNNQSSIVRDGRATRKTPFVETIQGGGGGGEGWHQVTKVERVHIIYARVYTTNCSEGERQLHQATKVERVHAFRGGAAAASGHNSRVERVHTCPRVHSSE